MHNKRTLRILISALVIGLSVHFVGAQSKISSAKERFERARSYSAADDPRAEQEYKQAISDRKGVYPEAWEWLSRYLARNLRFGEAASAWRHYVQQTEKTPPRATEQQARLDRATLLQSRSHTSDTLSVDEMLELIKLVDGYGKKGDAVPYAEKAVELHPESAKALVALADLIKITQKERALELFDRAIVFQPTDPSLYVIRGGVYFWVHGNSVKAEADFRKAIELSDGSNASAQAGLGDSLARQGRRDEALAAYRRYLAIRPKSAAHYDVEIRKSIEMLKTSESKP